MTSHTPRPIVVAIVGHTLDYAIGYGPHLAVANKTDMRVFKTLTTGHAVLMGSNTLKSLPKPSGLPNRKNYLYLPKDRQLDLPGSEAVQRVHSIYDAVDTDIAQTDPDSILWIIGGAVTYSSLLEHCDYVLACVNEVEFAHRDLTRWDYSFRCKFSKDLCVVGESSCETVQASHLVMPNHDQPDPAICTMSEPLDTKFRYKLYFNDNNRTSARKRDRVFEEATVRKVQELLDQARS